MYKGWSTLVNREGNVCNGLNWTHTFNIARLANSNNKYEQNQLAAHDHRKLIPIIPAWLALSSYSSFIRKNSQAHALSLK